MGHARFAGVVLVAMLASRAEAGPTAGEAVWSAVIDDVDRTCAEVPADQPFCAVVPAALRARTHVTVTSREKGRGFAFQVADPGAAGCRWWLAPTTGTTYLCANERVFRPLAVPQRRERYPAASGDPPRCGDAAWNALERSLTVFCRAHARAGACRIAPRAMRLCANDADAVFGEPGLVDVSVLDGDPGNCRWVTHFDARTAALVSVDDSLACDDDGT